MKLKNLRLGIANVNTTTSKKDFEVLETSINRVRLEGGTQGRDIESYSIHVLAHKGDTLKIKVDKAHADKITNLTDAIKDDVTVMVTFEGLKLVAYAMAGSGSYPINSGVSGKADDFEFTVQRNEDDDIIL